MTQHEYPNNNEERGQAHQNLAVSFPVFFAKELVTSPASAAPIDRFVDSIRDDERQTLGHCLGHQSQIFATATTEPGLLKIFNPTMRTIHAFRMKHPPRRVKAEKMLDPFCRGNQKTFAICHLTFFIFHLCPGTKNLSADYADFADEKTSAASREPGD